MGWLKFIFLVLTIASLPVENSGSFLRNLGQFNSKAFHTLVRRPISWVKETYSDQLYIFRLSEFKNCLNASSFDPNNIIVRGEDMEDYEDVNQHWNLRKERPLPLAFVLPENVNDVVKAIRCGVQTKVPIIPNSGGLSFESLSWGTNETVIMDFQYMNNITTEEIEGGVTVSVQPGALVGHIHAHLWKNGGYGLAMSNHLTAGMAGDAIGGGHGAFSGLFGLTVDNILSLEMVNPFGEIHHANVTKNPDLWFGLRGMGSGLIGIVTRITLKTFKASDLQLTYATLRYPLKKTREVYDAFQKFHTWAEANDPTISRSLSITPDAYNKGMLFLLKGVTVNLLHIQDAKLQPKSNESFLEAISSIFPKDGEVSTSYPNYFQFVTTTGYAPVVYPREIAGVPKFALKVKLIKGEMPTDDELYQLMEILSKDRAAKRYFKIKSFFVNRLATEDELATINSIVKGMAKHVLVQVTSQTASVHSHARNENAYVHRNATFNLSVRYEGSPKNRAVAFGMIWLEHFWKGIHSLDGGETYQNYPDLDLEHHFLRTYRQNLGKLVDTKRKWDPDHYFATPLALPNQIIRQ